MIAIDPLTFNANGRSLNVSPPYVGREQQFVVAGVVVTALCTFHDNDFDFWLIIDKGKS